MVFYDSIVGEEMYFAKYVYKMKLLDSFSLKDKRSIRRSIISKIQNKFKVSIAEVEDADIHNVLCLAGANVSYSRHILEKAYYEILDLIETYELEVYDTYYEEF